MSKVQFPPARNHSYMANWKLKQRDMSVDNIYTDILHLLLLDVIQPRFTIIVQNPFNITALKWTFLTLYTCDNNWLPIIDFSCYPHLHRPRKTIQFQLFPFIRLVGDWIVCFSVLWSLFMWLSCKSINSYCIFQMGKIFLISLVHLNNKDVGVPFNNEEQVVLNLNHLVKSVFFWWN